MTRQLFPPRREDGSAEVAADFRASLEDARSAVDGSVAERHRLLEGVDTSPDLGDEPRIAPSAEGFRVLFKIRPGSRRWRDWAVALVSGITDQLGPGSFVGFFDTVAGRMHAAIRD
ncbi:MAG: hypothetical protein ACRD0M_11270 [Acidimicrobiales bacterium]